MLGPVAVATWRLLLLFRLQNSEALRRSKRQLRSSGAVMVMVLQYGAKPKPTRPAPAGALDDTSDHHDTIVTT